MRGPTDGNLAAIDAHLRRIEEIDERNACPECGAYRWHPAVPCSECEEPDAPTDPA